MSDQKYKTYLVGAFDDSGKSLGGEFISREDAEAVFTDLQAGQPRRIASVVLYGWSYDGECDQLKAWAA